MPYVSLAQERWAHTQAGTKALGGPAKVAEWDAATKGKDLPQRKLKHERLARAMVESKGRD
jgi:hypothetical protein